MDNSSGFAVGLSEHPEAAVAAGEAFGAVLEGVGDSPDLAVLFVAAEHRDSMADIVEAVHGLVAPRVLIGATTSTVIGNRREVESGPAIALWAKRMAPGVSAAHLTVVPGVDGNTLSGITPEFATPSSAIVLADPASFPAEEVFHRLTDLAPSVSIVGGMASAGIGPHQNRLVVGSEVVDTGAVVVLLPHGDADANLAQPLVSQGCRPVGEPLIVTAGSQNWIGGLGGKPPLERLRQLFEAAGEVEAAQLGAGVLVGKVVDESKVYFNQGDFLVRGILGVDEPSGSILIGNNIEIGQTLQFHIRDAATAKAELAELAAGRFDGGLLFTCNGRGCQMFETPDHDASTVQDAGGPMVLAGMACAGEFGPIGADNYLHTFTASALLFGR